MKSRNLTPLPLEEALKLQSEVLVVTMAEGQWDSLLSAAYQQGSILLELDENDVPVRAYQKPDESPKEPTRWRL